MKIVGIDVGASQFRISEGDRLWVEENFRWLKEVFGYPNSMEEQVLFNARFFPLTFSSPVKVDHVVTDLCNLFGIPREAVKHEALTDLRGLNNIPRQVEAKNFACETDINKGAHKILIASGLEQHPERLVDALIYEFIQIRLTESELEFDVGGDDTRLFIYIAGIYYGFGVMLAQNLIDKDGNKAADAQIKWNHGSEMPRPVMAFALATYANLTGYDNPSWKEAFTGDFKQMLEDAIVYLQNNPNDLYDEQEVKANNLFNQANDHFDRNELDEAISTLQKILFITNDDLMKADVFNNMGYYYMRTKNYQLGISNFRKALALGPEYGFASDNLGYALIMTGELEEGKACLEKAIQTGNNDIAYTYRNFALYHQRRGDSDLAEEFFVQSLAVQTPVDLLEYHYAEFLHERGDVENAKFYFELSAQKNEQEGMARLRELFHT